MPRDTIHVAGHTMTITGKEIFFVDHKTGKITKWSRRKRKFCPRTPIVYKKGDLSITLLDAGIRYSSDKDKKFDSIMLVGKVADSLGKTIQDNS